MSALCPPERLDTYGKAAGVRLTDRQITQLQTYLALLERWNRSVNLTALTLSGFPDAALKRLIEEPLLCASLLEDQRWKWFDLGSGGGSPAIPMKIALPSAQLTMVEARSRKAAFLREAIRTVGLMNSEVRNMRIEELNDSGLEGCVGLVSVRAVRLDRTIVDRVSWLLSRDGRLAVFSDQSDEIEGFEALAEKPPVRLLRRRQFVPRETIRG